MSSVFKNSRRKRIYIKKDKFDKDDRQKTISRSLPITTKKNSTSLKKDRFNTFHYTKNSRRRKKEKDEKKTYKIITSKRISNNKNLITLWNKNSRQSNKNISYVRQI
jgi:hypothetical protein